MNNKREESDDDENDDVNEYYDDDIEEDSDNDNDKDLDKFENLEKFRKTKLESESTINKTENKKGIKLTHYKDQPFDLAYEINESVDESMDIKDKEDYPNKKSDKNNNQFPNYDKFKKEDPASASPNNDIDITNTNNYFTPTVKQLPKYDMSEFYNLEVNTEIKDLLKIMNK